MKLKNPSSLSSRTNLASSLAGTLLIVSLTGGAGQAVAQDGANPCAGAKPRTAIQNGKRNASACDNPCAAKEHNPCAAKKLSETKKPNDPREENPWWL